MTQNPLPLSNGTAKKLLSRRNFVIVTRPRSIGVSRTFLAYHFAAASISHNFPQCTPLSHMLFTSLSISAKNCVSMNFSLTGCFGTYDRTSFTKTGSSMLSSVFIAVLFSRRGLSCRCDNFFSF